MTIAALVAFASDDDWAPPLLAFAHLPANQRQKDEHAEKKKKKPMLKDLGNYKQTTFYQVMPIREILYRVPIMPAKRSDLDDPSAFILEEFGWGF